MEKPNLEGLYTWRDISWQIGEWVVEKIVNATERVFPSEPTTPPLPEEPTMPAVPVEPDEDMTSREYLDWVLSNYAHDEAEYKRKLYGWDDS